MSQQGWFYDSRTFSKPVPWLFLPWDPLLPREVGITFLFWREAFWKACALEMEKVDFLLPP